MFVKRTPGLKPVFVKQPAGRKREAEPVIPTRSVSEGTIRALLTLRVGMVIPAAPYAKVFINCTVGLRPAARRAQLARS